MIFPLKIVGAVAQSCYWGDRAIRSDLVEGLIATENDYTSNLAAAIRRQINSRAIPDLRATSYVLKPSVERVLGADACIVLANAKEFKLCIFEAKWPRFSTNVNCWDSLQRGSGRSHFDEQIQRQDRLAHSLPTWEMFYSEHPFGEQPSYMPKYVSACVWHEHASAASKARANKNTPWTDNELIGLLESHASQIDTLIRDVCLCLRGQLFSGSNYLATFDNQDIPSEILVIRYNASNLDA